MEFLLRPWQLADAPALARYANNAAIADNLRDIFPHPYTLADAQSYIRMCMDADQTRQLCYAIEMKGEAAGSIGVFWGQDVYRRTAELGYWLAEPYWGRGVMRAAIREICAQAFDRFDLVRIEARPFAHNTGSRKALAYAGFVLEGVLHRSAFKNGRVLDTCMYALYQQI